MLKIGLFYTFILYKNVYVAKNDFHEIYLIRQEPTFFILEVSELFSCRIIRLREFLISTKKNKISIQWGPLIL